MKKLDFVTTPGYLDGYGAREKVGLPEGSGPYRVITQLGVFGYEPESKEMMLLSMHSGVTVTDIQENSAFEILIPEYVSVTEPPTEEEIRLLHEIDPMGMSIGK
jgi:glutaconate CoA-transferase subunit B